jgi:threonine aldolase
MDGARIFNAAVGLGVDVREFTQHVDSVMFCLSKGLSAPIGSIVAGSRAFIERARRARQLLGGGWRQAGVIAAAGIVALEKGIERLAEDHANARKLAEGLVRIAPGCVNLKNVQTNMVYIHTNTLGMTGQEVVDRLAAHGVLFSASDPYRVRLVTHRWVSSENIDYTLEAFRRVLGSS